MPDRREFSKRWSSLIYAPWTRLSTVVDVDGRRLATAIRYFSNYAVAY